MRLELEGNFTSEAARAAAALALVNHELNNLSGKSVSTSRSTQGVSRDTEALARSANNADTSINKLSGRLGLMVDSIVTLGPALVPIGAIGVPAVAGLANAMGIAALGAATAIASFQGVGTALKAVDSAAINPTTANLLKMNQALDGLSPAARDLVQKLHDLEPTLKGLRDAGAEALFPGVQKSIDDLLTRLPDVRRLITAVANGLSDTLTHGAADLASSRWDDFFRFLADEAPKTLISLGRITSSIAHGLAEIWVAFAPLNNGFTNWLVEVAAGFDRWATGLQKTAGFAEFLDYVRTSGPQVLATTEALANALLQIVEAAAPLGGPVLHALQGIFSIIGDIANSDLGTPILIGVSALRLLSRATEAYGGIAKTTWGAQVIGNIKGAASAITEVTTAQDRARLSAVDLAKLEEERAVRVRAGLATVAKGAAAIGALGLVATGAADQIGLTNTASLGLIGTMGGPWGMAAGLAAGATLDLVHSNDQLQASIARTDGTIQSGSIPAMEQLRGSIQAALDAFNKQTDSKGGIADFLSSLVHLPANAFALFTGSIDQASGAVNILNSAIESAKRGTRGLPQILGGDLLTNLGLLGAGFHTAGQSISEFNARVDRANSVLTGRSALRSYQQALDDFNTAVKQNGKSLDITTQKGRNVQAALDNIAGTALAAAQSLQGLGRVKYLDQARKDFIGAAEDLGKTKSQAQQLADRLGLLDQIKAQPKVQIQGMQQLNANLDELNAHFDVIDHLMGGPTVNVQGVPNAIAAVNSVLHAMGLLHDKTVTITTHYNATYGGQAGGGGHSVTTQADGGILERYAIGGVRAALPKVGDQAPQVRPYSGPRGILWSEEGSGPWEAFISGAPSKRDRSRAIAAEVVARLGGHVRFADGGMVSHIPAPVVNVQGASRDELKMFADLIGDRVGDRVAKAVRSNGQASYAGRRV